MKHELKKLDKSQVELTVTVPVEEYEADLKAASARMSEKANIKGFRPGKAPMDVVIKNFGEQKVLEEALQTIVQKTFFKAVQEEKIETVGMPQIAVEKLAPGNEVVYKATVALMPKVKLPDLNKIKVEKKEVKVDNKEIDEALGHLQKMQPKEVLKNDKANDKDKVIIDMEMFLNKVPVEGGQTKNHGVYLSEKYYIPGLEKKLIGAKKGDEKEFTLKFPEKHYQNHLAGKNIDFKVKVHDVYELQYPELNDDFAKTLGMKDLNQLKDTLKKNITQDQNQKENQRVDAEMMEKIIEKSEFDEIPEVITTSEKQKMFYELKADLEQRGLEMKDYLANIKKTEEEIFNDFQSGAEKRAKASLVSRQIASENNITVPKEELEKEIEIMKEMYKNNEQAQENLKRPEVHETIAAAIQNRKVMTFLREKILGEKEKQHECNCGDDCKENCGDDCKCEKS